MVDNEEDEPFCQEFIARAQERQKKLAEMERLVLNKDKDVSYPSLSPLAEEQTVISDDDEEEDSYPQLENRFGASTRDTSPQPSDLNYSSDLSLECSKEEEEVYRAEPVICQASPEVRRRIIPISQKSPQKLVPSAPVEKSAPKQDLSTPLQERQVEQKTSSQSLPETSSADKYLKELQLKLDRTDQAKAQLRKAVELSKYGTSQHIEAAKLLQVADIEHLSYTNLLAMHKQGIRKKTESLGSINISDVRLKMSTKLRNDLAEDGVSHNFFCVASCGADVKATEIINTDDIRKQDLKAYLFFKEKLVFNDLPSDFVIKVEVFELVAGQHLPKFLSRLTPSKRTKITLESNFRRVGSMKLTLSDRDVNFKNLVQWSKHEESKYIERECKFTMTLKPEQLPYKSGMLHVRCLDNDGRPDWSRFFVELSNGQIRLWKSKQDAHDGKKPNQIIQFQDLCSPIVQKLTPDDDLYRQNSFVIYTYVQVAGGEKDNLFQRLLKDEPVAKIAKHQLAAQSKEDRDSWCSVLDKSIQCFREWHGKTRIFSFEEIKEVFSSSY